MSFVSQPAMPGEIAPFTTHSISDVLSPDRLPILVLHSSFLADQEPDVVAPPCNTRTISVHSKMSHTDTVSSPAAICLR
jgi:hypothetical protein